MDSPELTERFVTLASVDNKAIMAYYQYMILGHITKYVKKTDHLLDLGCAGGVMLTLLRQRGYQNLYGIDAARVLLDRIPDKTIHTVCDNYINMKDHYEKHQFDAATIFNTLHHLESKDLFYTFFENLHHICKPGATILVKELYDGAFYRVYNAVIRSRIANTLFPSVFSRRNYVEREERGIHSHFFNNFVPNISDIIESEGKFRIIGVYYPLGFERVIVARPLAGH